MSWVWEHFYKHNGEVVCKVPKLDENPCKQPLECMEAAGGCLEVRQGRGSPGNVPKVLRGSSRVILPNDPLQGGGGLGPPGEHGFGEDPGEGLV